MLSGVSHPRARLSIVIKEAVEMKTDQKNSGLLYVGRGLGFAVASFLGRRQGLRSEGILLGLLLGVAPLCLPATGEAEELTGTGNLPFTDPYAFVDRFTDSPEVKALGFPVGSGPSLEVGMIVEKEKAKKAGSPIDIVSAAATNGKVTIDLTHADIGILDLWDKWVVFDPKNHKGRWIIKATSSKGTSAATQPVLLDYGFELPLVENVSAEKTASGDLKVTWSAPEIGFEIKDKCDIDYRLRLLQDVDKQFYRSDRTTETFVTVPADTLKEKLGDNLHGDWGRIEMLCHDKEQKDKDGVGELEARSNTLFPLT
jgi:hypothetical protein